MKADRLRGINSRSNRATPGPWKVIGSGWLCADKTVMCNLGEERPEDASFIANARQDIPDLLAALDEARELLKEARRAHFECSVHKHSGIDNRCDLCKRIDAVIGGE